MPYVKKLTVNAFWITCVSDDSLLISSPVLTRVRSKQNNILINNTVFHLNICYFSFFFHLILLALSSQTAEKWMQVWDIRSLKYNKFSSCKQAVSGFVGGEKGGVQECL